MRSTDTSTLSLCLFDSVFSDRAMVVGEDQEQPHIQVEAGRKKNGNAWIRLNFMIIITRNEWQTTEVWLLLPNYYRKKAESQIETIIESNNSRNLLNDSTTRWEAGSNRCLESVLS